MLLLRVAGLRLLEEDERFRSAVNEGKRSAERGEFIEEDHMDARFEQMMRD
jgi:predicted transcriptional regulator